jgi:DNA repair protein RadC
MTYEIISTRKIRKTIKFLLPEDIYSFIKRYAKNTQEQFLTITLNGAHEVLCVHISTIGLVNRTIIHPREVFRHAMKDNASAIVIVHNHPSGRLTPSPEDCDITDRMKKASEIIGIHLLDHLIIGKNGYYSFRQDNNILTGQ